jgi:hypothetical protein
MLFLPCAKRKKRKKKKKEKKKEKEKGRILRSLDYLIMQGKYTACSTPHINQFSITRLAMMTII